MLVDPIDSQSAPIDQDHGERLARRGYRFYQVLFRLRQVDAGAVSTEEAGFTDRHLFSFELACDAHNGNYDIRILCSCDRFRRWSVVRFGPDQLCLRSAVPAAVRNLESGLAALIEVDSAYLRGQAATAKGQRDLLAIRRNPAESRAADAEQKIARFRRRQKSRPLHAEGFLAGDLRWQVCSRELHVTLSAAHDRRTVRAPGTSAHAFVVVGLQAGLAVGSRQESVGHRHPISMKELRSGTNVMVALGNSALSPSIMDTICV